MIMDAWKGLHTAASLPTARSRKRSFDVAFLTGAKDTHDEITQEDRIPKICKLTDRSDRDSPSEAGGSAFTKVTRAQDNESPPFLFENSQLHQWSSSASFDAMNTLLGAAKLPPLISTSGFFPHALAPLLSPPTSCRTDGVNNNFVEEYFKTQRLLNTKSPIVSTADISPSEALSRLRSIPSSESYKLPFSGLPYITGSNQTTESKIPFLGAPVSPLIPPTLTTMSLPAQNLCARCNISFRMTSDLVYHMRSQHKKDPDPYKKRRNEKLKCPICLETFRERHHLTRHMTAHQDRAEEKDEKKL